MEIIDALKGQKADPTFNILGPSRSQTIFPEVNERTLATLYPSNLKLHLVCVIHRHGHRTPLRHRLHGLMPYIWPHCQHPESLSHLFPRDTFIKEALGNHSVTLGKLFYAYRFVCDFIQLFRL